MKKGTSVFLKLVFVAIVSCLGISTFHYQKNANFYQKQLAFAHDTLTNILAKDERWISVEAFKLMGEKEVDLGDTLSEVHRFSWVTNQLFVVRVEVYPDNTVRLNFSSGGLQNTNDSEKLKLVLRSEKNREISWAQWQEFHQKISKVSFLDATKDENFMCCLTTGTLRWDAISVNSGRHGHSTWCRQSIQFAEACEYVFQFFDDPDLKRALQNARR